MSKAISDTGSTPQKDMQDIPTSGKANKGGLEGIVAATTAISKVEGTVGRLIYRGYTIHDLARTTSFEEIVHLLWFGHLPNQQELSELHARFAAERTLPAEVLQVIQVLPAHTEPMDVLRTAVSAWGALSIKGKPTVEQAIALTARFPLILAAFHRLRTGKEILESRSELSHAANYLYLLTGQEPSQEHVQGLNSYLV
ncbi:MAG TPA: citrate/2-methylcitrate synthase, partial [Ktedonobacteraceae bacterium]